MYTLYGAEISYFTGKARAYLSWKQIDFTEVQATKEIYQSVILTKVGWPVIPVLEGPGDEILQDTSDIIDTLEARHEGVSIIPNGDFQQLAALLFEVIGDEWLVIPAMHYRWAYNREWAHAEFGKMAAPDQPPEEQLKIGRKNAVLFEGALPVLGVIPEAVPAIEAAYETFLAQFSAHLEHHDFLLGARPCIGDFGLYGPLYAHLYRDPASGEIMADKAPKVAAWVERMRDAKGAPGAFVAGDTVPETLLPMLTDQLRDFVPVLRSTADALSNWAADKPSGEPVPRALGPHAFQINGTDSQRMIFPFNLWMLQRPVDHYRALSGDDRLRADKFLENIGALSLFQDTDWPRLTRQAFKLVLA